MASEVKFLLDRLKIGTIAESMASNLPVPEPMQVQGNVQANWTCFNEQWHKIIW